MQIDKAIVKEAWQQYGDLMALAHVPLASASICSALRWEGDAGANIGYSVQAVLAWAVERLGAQGGKTKPENAKILINRFIFGHSIAQSADLHNKDVEYIKRRTRSAWKQTTDILAEESVNMRDAATRATWVCEERFATLSKQGQTLLRFMAVFDRPIPPTYLIYHDHQLPDLLAANVVQRCDNQHVQVHPRLVAYVRDLLTIAEQQTFHAQAGDLYAGTSHVLLAAAHWQQAGRWMAAADLLIANRDKLGDLDERHALDRWQAVLQQFDRHQLGREQRAQIELMLGNVAKLTKAPLSVALAAYRRAMLAAETTATKAEIYFERGHALQESDVQDAVTQLNECTRLPSTPNVVYWHIKAQLLLAWLHRTQLNDPAKAICWLNQIESALAGRVGAMWDGLRADWHNTWSEHYKYEELADSSLGHSTQAVVMAERAQDPLRIVKMMFQLGVAYYRAGQSEKGKQSLTQCDAWAIKMEYDTMRGRVQQVWGARAFDQGRYAEAIHHYQLAAAAFDQAGEKRPYAAMQYNQAEALFELGKGNRAVDLMARGRTIAEESGNQNLRDIFESDLRNRYVESHTELNARQRYSVWFTRGNAGKITNQEYQTINDCSSTTARRELNQLQALELLKRVGKGRGTYYCLA